MAKKSTTVNSKAVNSKAVKGKAVKGDASNDDTEILRYALAHLETERDLIVEKIQRIAAQLTDGGPGGGRLVRSRQRSLSASARKRIGQAQRQRWALYRARAKEGTATT